MGWQGCDEAAREKDEALLRTRLCSEHCPCHELESFHDVERVREAREGGGRPTVVETEHTVSHCPLSEGAMVLAALRQKVGEVCGMWSSGVAEARARAHTSAQSARRLAEAAASARPTSSVPVPAVAVTSSPALTAAAATAAAAVALATATLAAATAPSAAAAALAIANVAVNAAAKRRVFIAKASDRLKRGAERIDCSGTAGLEAVRQKIDRSARGQLRELHVYVGMHGVLTDNKSMKDDFINGTTGVVTEIHCEGGVPRVIYFRPDGAEADLRVAPKRTECTLFGVGTVERYQFPLLPVCGLPSNPDHAQLPTLTTHPVSRYPPPPPRHRLSASPCIVCRAAPSRVIFIFFSIANSSLMGRRMLRCRACVAFRNSIYGVSTWTHSQRHLASKPNTTSCACGRSHRHTSTCRARQSAWACRP